MEASPVSIGVHALFLGEEDVNGGKAKVSFL